MSNNYVRDPETGDETSVIHGNHLFTGDVDVAGSLTQNGQPLSGGGITNSAPVNTIPVTVDGDGNLGPQTNVPLVDPGNVWEPNTAVTEGYRIAETVQGELRVFEAVSAGTTGDLGAFTDLTISLLPLGLTSDDDFSWRYLGVVGQLSWELAPLQSAFGQDNNGPYVAGTQSISQGETTFRILPALGDPGNAWEAETALAEANYRILVLVNDSSRVFGLTAPGTTGASEPEWDTSALGNNTADGTANWAYLGIVGNPDFERQVFVTNSAGDADWFLDINNGSGFRFNLSEDGIPVSGGLAQFTTDGFKIAGAPGFQFEVRYDPFAIIINGLPTADPGAGFEGQLWNDNGTVKISAGI